MNCGIFRAVKMIGSLEQRALSIGSLEKSVRSQRICSPRSGAKDFLLTNPDKFRDSKEKFGHTRCREDMWAKYINRSEQLCKGPSGTRGASTSERGGDMQNLNEHNITDEVV